MQRYVERIGYRGSLMKVGVLGVAHAGSWGMVEVIGTQIILNVV